MPTIDTSYEPFDPLNICSICGTLERKSRLKRLPGGLYGCSRESCAGERTALELDRANARQRPFRILPVRNARPQSWNLPDDYQDDEGTILNFCDRMVAAQCRFESVAGGTPAPLASPMLPAFGWIARYLYGMIAENKRPKIMLEKATSLLSTIVVTLQGRQSGFGIDTATTRANYAFYGGFLEAGATEYVTVDSSLAGFAMLYMYRLTGSNSYLASARAAASYLENVQAVGRCASNAPSSNPNGGSRLYTGAVASAVSTYQGIDSNDFFYANHLYYAYDLLTLEFWNALMTTDGDQSIGATTAVNGFPLVPAQLLSKSITDMRTFWADGVRDSAGETYTGLSVTTPREYFNAYPTEKIGFAVTGTGRWEYQDGGATVGTMLTAQNFSIALESLFTYEGASAQVSAVSDWLRSFSANPTFDATGNESIRELARSTVGPFEATSTPTTLLQVRDPSTLAATAINGSSLYDWGAFGALSALWGSRNTSSFTQSRMLPLGRNQRFYDGTRSDGDHFDHIVLRGESGLGYQTAFSVNLTGYDAGSTQSAGGAPPSVPPQIGTGLVLWLKGEFLVSSGGVVSGWTDKSGYSQDFTTDPGQEPSTGVATINNIPCMSIASGGTGYVVNGSGIVDRNGATMGYGTGETRTFTVMAIFRPGLTSFSFYGGVLFHYVGSFQPPIQALFDMESLHVASGLWLYSEGWRDYAISLQGPTTSVVAYNGAVTIGTWKSSGFPDISVAINGDDTTLTPSSMPGAIGGPATPRALVGNSLTAGFGLGFVSDIAELLVFDNALGDDDQTQATQYLAGRAGLVSSSSFGMVNDVIRAAQFGQSFRVNPTFPMSV